MAFLPDGANGAALRAQGTTMDEMVRRLSYVLKLMVELSVYPSASVRRWLSIDRHVRLHMY